eukprot:Anaeramoba_ignava/c7229_g1_i1.p1 GENE.c7229_g1_i1~~c7229_g1_i1.p1  ORF type:complete len:267 (+),score=94.47 c7229_g1_i1:29-829(+)
MQQQQQQTQQQQIQIVPNTRFEELPEPIQKHFLQFEQELEKQKETRIEVATKELKETVEQIEKFEESMENLGNAYNKDSVIVNQIKKENQQQAYETEEANRLLETLKNSSYREEPSQLSPYFEKLLEKIQSKMVEYNTIIEDIESFISSNSQQPFEQFLAQQTLPNPDSKTNARVVNPPKVIHDTIHSQYQKFMELVGKISFIHEQVDILREEFLRIFRHVFPNSPNPLDQPDQDDVENRAVPRFINLDQDNSPNLIQILPNSQFN